MNGTLIDKKNIRITSQCIFFAAVLILCGCNDKSAKNIKTEDMHISAILMAENTSKVEIQVSLSDGKFFGDDYVLGSGDRLMACVNSICNRMNIDTLGDLLPGQIYSGSLPYYSNADYIISLYRKIHTDAPDSRVSLSLPFNIYEPSEGTSYTDGDTIRISWTPYDTLDDVKLEPDVICKHEDGSTSTTHGDMQIDPHKVGYFITTIEDNLDVVNTFEESPLVSCEIDLIVTSQRRGAIDPVYKDGFINGTVSRKIRVKYLPTP